MEISHMSHYICSNFFFFFFLSILIVVILYIFIGLARIEFEKVPL